MATKYVFLIHSRLDTEWPNFFDKAAGKAEVRLFEAEWFDEKSPNWLHLKEQIRRSMAVFFLKGPSITNSTYTTNWVSWECGVAAALKRDLWVFESMRNPVFMPVPYLTDYVPYDPQDNEHVAFVANLLQNYSLGEEPPQGWPVTCPKCGAQYNLHAVVVSWNCPTCQRYQAWEDPAFAEQLVHEPGLLLFQNMPLTLAQHYYQVRKD